jgi:hypothetical protein
VNTVKVSKQCAKDVAAAVEESGREPPESSGGKLYFNTDDNEWMDYVSDDGVQAVLKKYKVKGDICFGSLEGDNAGSFWGYRFDGKGGMQELEGRLCWDKRKP